MMWSWGQSCKWNACFRVHPRTNWVRDVQRFQHVAGICVSHINKPEVLTLSQQVSVSGSVIGGVLVFAFCVSLHGARWAACVALEGRSLNNIADSGIKSWNRPWCLNCFFLLHLLWPFKRGSGITTNYPANIFPNKNPMTQCNLSLIQALPKIVVRPQIWHGSIQSLREAHSGVSESFSLTRQCNGWNIALSVNESILL